MICESGPWKLDLAKRADWLLERQNQRRWSEASCVRAEQCVLVGCYCVRKLIEAKKLTKPVAEQSISLRRHSSTGKRVHHMNWHRIDELYNLERSTREQRTLKFVCHQLIHSFVFALTFSEDTRGLDGVYFCSDRERNKHLFHLAVTDLAASFRSVADDDPVSVLMIWNPTLGDFEVSLE